MGGGQKIILGGICSPLPPPPGAATESSSAKFLRSYTKKFGVYPPFLVKIFVECVRTHTILY